MSYRPSTPYRRELSSATAEDEAYEMIATRSATHNTLRVTEAHYQPLASPDDIRSGDHPVVAAKVEPYETDPTRSATNNIVRVVDDSYRPLASSDDVRSGASSHTGAYVSPVTRDSISSAPRQDETTDDPEFNSSALHGSSEELQRGKAIERFKASYMRGALDS
jgi:hypothetical protein